MVVPELTFGKSFVLSVEGGVRHGHERQKDTVAIRGGGGDGGPHGYACCLFSIYTAPPKIYCLAS